MILARLLLAAAPRLEAADQAQILARISRVGDGAIVPVQISDRLGTGSLVIRISIDLVERHPVLSEVVLYFVLSASRVDHDLPALGAKLVQGCYHVWAGFAQDAGALVTVIISYHAVEVE